MALSTCLLLQDNIRKIGPWGGSGGGNWDMVRVDATTRINKIVIRHGVAIDSIAFQYEQNGTLSCFPSKGGNGGKPSEINLQPGEFLTSINGCSATFEGNYVVIRSLTFTSNMQTYGPYGQETGTPFFFSTANVEIVGFHGRSGKYLEAIGIYVAPVACLSSQDNIRRIGPWGGSGGNNWDMVRVDANTRINKIIIRHGGAIDSIAFRYEKNGMATLFPSKGGNGGWPSEIDLQPDEFLTSIQGHWSAFLGVAGMIRSLTFISNICQYGPYGEEKGTPFSLSMPNVEIVGFHGSSGTYLDSIGIYVAHNHRISPQENVRILGPLAGFGERKWDNEREDSTPYIKRHDDQFCITAHPRKAAEPNSAEVILRVHCVALQPPEQREGSNSRQPGARGLILGAKKHDDVRGKGGFGTTPVDSLVPSSIIDAEVMMETRELRKMVASLQTQLVDMQKVITQLLQSIIGSSGRADPQASTSRVGDSHDKHQL